MKLFKVTSIRTVILCFCVFALVIAAACRFIVLSAQSGNAKTAEQRMIFANSLGVSTDKSSEKTKEVQIPLDFPDVYEKYNELQRQAGYDLTVFRGETVTLYSYPVKDAPRFTLNLLVYRGGVIGVDLSSNESDGVMVPLDKKEIEKCLK